MATYTDNYSMTKPTYAEQADIMVINANMDIIDGVMHSSQISLANAYDSTATYNKGDVVMYELLMYVCKADNTTGVWDSTKWERTTASECGASEKLIGVASGQPASFPDGSDNPLEACSVDINPIQDLHGYDKPWAGGANIQRWDEEYEAGTINAATGQPLSYSDRIRSKNYSKCEASTDYYVSIGFNVALRIFWYKSNNTYITYDQINASSGRIITSPAEATYFKVSTEGTTYGETYRNDISVNYPSTETVYSPYSNICPITPRTEVNITVSDTLHGVGTDTQIALGRNVYGGTLNVKTGELTVTHAFVTIDGTEAGVSWTDIGNNMRSSILNLYVLKSAPESTGANAEAISNYLEKVPKNYSADVTGFYWYDERQVYVKLNKASLPSADTAGCTTFLQNNNLTICYEMGTPLNYTLTPEEVRSILGQNYIEADSGEIEVAYVRDLNSCISNIISRIEALEQANSNRSLNLNRSLSKGIEELSEEPQEVKEEEPEVKEEENNER